MLNLSTNRSDNVERVATTGCSDAELDRALRRFGRRILDQRLELQAGRGGVLRGSVHPDVVREAVLEGRSLGS